MYFILFSSPIRKHSPNKSESKMAAKCYYQEKLGKMCRRSLPTICYYCI